MLSNTNSKLKRQKIISAHKLGLLGFELMLSKIKVGISEQELADVFKAFIASCGAGFSFPVIVAFGKSTSEVHHPTGEVILKRGDLVMIDFGVELKGYCSDMTRTFVFGKPTKKQQKMLDAVKSAQQLAVDFIQTKLNSKEQILAREVDKVARDYLISLGYPSIPHALGHGIGHKVHEDPKIAPKSEDVLASGMVFSIEPGIYLSGFGGVRIEDLYTIKDGICYNILDA